MDANFHIIGLKKNNNLAEKALTAGRGYIRDQDKLDEHLKKHASMKDTEVSRQIIRAELPADDEATRKVRAPILSLQRKRTDYVTADKLPAEW